MRGDRLADDHGPRVRWPSASFAINTAWLTAVALAIDLLCWMRLLLLDGPLAKAQPTTLRYRLLHAAARLVRRSRYLILRIPRKLALGQGFRRRGQPRPGSSHTRWRTLLRTSAIRARPAWSISLSDRHNVGVEATGPNNLA